MRKRILFVQPSLDPPGGANGVAAWMLDSLTSDHQVTILSMIEFKAELTDAYYGTSLACRPIENIVFRSLFLDALQALPLPTGLLQLHLFMRYARKEALGPYDLVCSAFDEQDFGVPCIEYVNYPWNLFPRPDAPPSWNESQVIRVLVKIYNWLCCQVSGFRVRRRPRNLTLVNSNWAGRVMRSVYPGTPCHVLNPPALAEPIVDDRSRRRPRFLSIGRIVQSKEWEKLIDIVCELRRRGHDVGLTLAGSRHQAWYEELIRERIKVEGDWVRLVTDFTREDLQEMMLTHEYGLHGMRDEHYGMAVAELLLGGCLTMVPDDGGQVEIVTDSRLHYSCAEDAVDKWDRILRDPELKAELFEGQQAHRSHLTKERFVREFDAVVKRCLDVGVEGAAEDLGVGTQKGQAK